jgi:hypothetical protein
VSLRTKSWTAPRRPMTPAQAAANERSFRIFRLRGLWYSCLLLTGERQAAAQASIDAELALLGAEPEGERRAADRFAVIAETEIPF